MTDPREDLWLRFLSSQTLTTNEKKDLLRALDTDSGFRKTVLDDAELHGLLRAFGSSDRDGEGFLKGVSDFLSAENDESKFISRLDARMEREGLLSQKGELLRGPEASGRPGEKIRSDFGNPGSMQYNSSRKSMPVIVNLEGSEEDFAKLLILHQIITTEQLTKALENRQAHSTKGANIEPLRDTLLRMGIVSSSLIFEVLRVGSKVIEECTKCGAVHHIYYYHPHARFFCAYCKGPLRLTESGQALKWTPSQVAAAAAKASAAATPAPIRRNPLDDPSVSLPAAAADETVFDLGTKVRAKPDASRPAAAAPPPAKPAPKPAALPPQVKPAPFDPTITILPLAGDETMLDMGATPRSKTMKPAASPLSPPTPTPTAKALEPVAPDVSISKLSVGDETMLDMGETPKSKTMKPAASAPAPAALPDQTIKPMSMGDETMLDMGDTPKSKSMQPAVSAEPPPATGDHSDAILNDVMDTMLDMGSRPKGKAMLLPGEKPEFPVVPKAPIQDIADFTTSVIPGKTQKRSPSISTTQDASKKGNPEVTRTGPAIDPTLMVTPPSSQAPGYGGSTGTISNVDKTQMATPKQGSGSGMGSAALANQKAMPAEAAAAAKDPARVFGKYVLLSELGRGGAGVVYKAWDTLLLQYVAVKFIRNQDDSDADSTSGSSQIEEFQKEARMSVRLRHPNIVRIYEMGCMSNRYYLSMEYIEGGTLLAMIHGGKERNQKTKFNTNPEQFLKIMINISLAVDYAHHEKQSVIHRDLKPHNVLVDKNMNPYVVDFGLAKEVDSGDGATLTGVVKGTPTYMAPEQAEGRNRDVDLRTDCYALGAILYEMLTGRPPFLGESVPEILRKIATELPERPNDVIAKTAAADAAAALAAAASATATASATGSSKAGKSKTKTIMVPKALETICLKALEKNKADRYQTAKEFAEDIDRYVKGEDILASEPNLWRRARRAVRKHPILSAAAAAILLASMTGVIAVKARGNEGISTEQLVEGIVERGNKALKEHQWADVKAAATDLERQSSGHPKIVEYRKAVLDHEELLARTTREWNADLDRIRREPLSKVLPSLREKYTRLPELQAGFRSSLKGELLALQQRVMGESNRLVGNGARPAWVEEIIKQNARECKEQLETLSSLDRDKEFPNPKEADVATAIEGLTRVIEYQGTWSLKVNVAPFAQITVRRADKELATDFTPLGLQELEVVGTSYVVELNWPSRENSKVKMKEEIKDLHHGQTIVIRGDLSKQTLTQERK